MVEVSSEFVNVAKLSALDEFRDYLVYSTLARVEWHRERREVLHKLATQEFSHFQFWSKFVNVKPSVWFWFYAYLLAFLRLFMGVTFVVKLLERGEEKTIERYKTLERFLQGEELEQLRGIVADEESHESTLVAELDETLVKYMSALVLGLADAIVEITAAHAGALGSTNSTIVAGVVGLIVGIGASISMASASFLQTKHEVGKSPTIAALVTGVGYMAAVALMSLPYFITHEIYLAFAASITVAIFLAFVLTFQASVYAGRDFKFEFLQTTALLLGTAALTYLVGKWLGAVFGIEL